MPRQGYPTQYPTNWGRSASWRTFFSAEINQGAASPGSSSSSEEELDGDCTIAFRAAEDQVQWKWHASQRHWEDADDVDDMTFLDDAVLFKDGARELNNFAKSTIRKWTRFIRDAGIRFEGPNSCLNGAISGDGPWIRANRPVPVYTGELNVKSRLRVSAALPGRIVRVYEADARADLPEADSYVYYGPHAVRGPSSLIRASILPAWLECRLLNDRIRNRAIEAVTRTWLGPVMDDTSPMRVRECTSGVCASDNPLSALLTEWDSMSASNLRQYYDVAQSCCARRVLEEISDKVCHGELRYEGAFSAGLLKGDPDDAAKIRVTMDEPMLIFADMQKPLLVGDITGEKRPYHVHTYETGNPELRAVGEHVVGGGKGWLDFGWYSARILEDGQGSLAMIPQLNSRGRKRAYMAAKLARKMGNKVFSPMVAQKYTNGSRPDAVALSACGEITNRETASRPCYARVECESSESNTVNVCIGMTAKEFDRHLFPSSREMLMIGYRIAKNGNEVVCEDLFKRQQVFQCKESQESGRWHLTKMPVDIEDGTSLGIVDGNENMRFGAQVLQSTDPVSHLLRGKDSLFG